MHWAWLNMEAPPEWFERFNKEYFPSGSLSRNYVNGPAKSFYPHKVRKTVWCLPEPISYVDHPGRNVIPSRRSTVRTNSGDEAGEGETLH
jgi:hypothetical protein